MRLSLLFSTFHQFTLIAAFFFLRLLLQNNNSFPQEPASSETNTKPRRRRRFGRKSKSSHPGSEASVPTQASTGNPIQSSILPNRVVNRLNSPVTKEVKETPVDRSFSNNISRSYMDKMKREDDAKSRESVLAERDARRLSKQKVQDKSRDLGNTSPTKSVQKQETVKIEDKLTQTPSPKVDAGVAKSEIKIEKTREEVMAERELKKQAKLAKKSKTTETTVPSSATVVATTTETIAKKLENVTVSEKPVMSKAERREKQEAQRAAKAKLLADKAEKVQKPVQSTDTKSKTTKVEKVKEISVRFLLMKSNAFS